MSSSPHGTANKPHLKKWWPAYLVVGAVAVLAFSYALFFTPESASELTLDDDSQAAPTGASDLSGSWVPAGDSIAGYRVREKLAQLPAPNDAVGRTSAVSGEVIIEDTGSSITAIAGSIVEIDMTTLKSDEERRDDRIRTTALETDAFPQATFELTEDLDLPESLRAGEQVTMDAAGELTLHGETQPVQVPLDIRLSGEQVEIAGNLEITMADYGIDADAFGGFVSVKEQGAVEFVLSLQK